MVVSRRMIWGCWGLSLELLSGCSQQPPTYPVHGMVIYPDGKPVTRGTIEFEPVGTTKPMTASGEIRSDGTFRLGTYRLDDGAVAGEHRAAVISDYSIGTGVERPGEIPPAQLGSKFRSVKTSGLKFRVEPRMNNFVIDVDYEPTEESN